MNAEYWEERYASGGDSGAGSQGELGAMKVDRINRLVAEQPSASVIDWGCGDGLLLSQFDWLEGVDYLGIDVSPTAIARCMGVAPWQQFWLYDRHSSIQPMVEDADLALSISVIYHLVDDDDFHDYMARLFASAYTVCVWASDRDEQTAPHVRHRAWTQRLLERVPDWRLIEQPAADADEGFYICVRT